MSRILLSQADVTEVEEQFVLDALRSGWVAPLGPHVDAFEAEVAERVGVAGAVALSSGTAALHVALLGLGAKPGTAVVLPSMTFAASANAVVHAGATPVFVDSQMSDGNVDPQLLIDAVDMLRAEGTVVSAVMTVDLFGRCVEYGDIVRALNERSIPLVEDAAEALGATQDGIAAGAFGKAGRAVVQRQQDHDDVRRRNAPQRRQCRCWIAAGTCRPRPGSRRPGTSTPRSATTTGSPTSLPRWVVPS